MARRIFWTDPSARVDNTAGVPIAGANVTMWTRRTGGTQVTDLQTVDDDGNTTGAISGGVVVCDAQGYLPSFAGPADGRMILWADAGVAGGRKALTADFAAQTGDQFSVLLADGTTYPLTSITSRPMRYLISNSATMNPTHLVNATTGAVTRTSDGASLGVGADKAWADALAGCGAYQARSGLIQFTHGDFHLKGPMRCDSGIRGSGAGADACNLIVDSDFSVGAVTGLLDAANGVPYAAVFMPDWQTAAGGTFTGGRWELDRFKIWMGDYTGTDLVGINYTTDAQPTFILGTRDVDPGLRIEHVIIDSSPLHGVAFVVGGYSGGARESRLANIECAKSGNRRRALTVTNKALTANVATLTLSAAHTVPVGASVTVALSPSDAVFDGTFIVTAVTSNTISYAKTNANVTSTASGGTATCGWGWDFWLDASDLYLYACTGNGARSGGFIAKGGNHRYDNCKAYYSGNVNLGAALPAPGFDFAASRGVASACESQDNGGPGFIFRVADWIGSGLMSDSNGAYASARTVQDSSNYLVLASSVSLYGRSVVRVGGNGDTGYPVFFSSGRSFIAGDVGITNARSGYVTAPTATTPNNALTSSTFVFVGSAT